VVVPRLPIPPRAPIRGQAHHAVRVLALCVAALLIAAGMLVSPVLFARVLRATGVSSTELSNAGQAYGGISAVLTLVALGGVIYTTALQIQDQRESRLEANRNLHSDLMKFAIEHPGFLEIWGSWVGEDPLASRKIAYANLIVTYWWHEYLVGVVRQEELLENFTYFFGGPVGRDYWSGARSYWTSTTITHGKALDRRRHAFAAVADAAYMPSSTLPRHPRRLPPERAGAFHLRASGGQEKVRISPGSNLNRSRPGSPPGQPLIRGDHAPRTPS
jgi:uncharacterized protein DUF6082